MYVALMMIYLLSAVCVFILIQRELARQTNEIIKFHMAQLAADGMPELRSALLIGGVLMKEQHEIIKRQFFLPLLPWNSIPKHIFLSQLSQYCLNVRFLCVFLLQFSFYFFFNYSWKYIL